MLHEKGANCKCICKSINPSSSMSGFEVSCLRKLPRNTCGSKEARTANFTVTSPTLFHLTTQDPKKKEGDNEPCH